MNIFVLRKVNFFYLYIAFLLLIPFLPLFGVIDMIGAHWFYLSILNVIYFLSFYKYFDFTSFVLSPSFKLYISFFLFSLLSLFFAKNIFLSFIDLSRIFLIISSVLLLLFLSRRYTSNNFIISISSIILFFTLFEVLFSIWPYLVKVYFLFFSDSTINISVSNLLGIAGNKNITAASIVFKLPFIFYLIYMNRYIIISFFTLLLSLMSILLIASRASYISFSVIFISSFVFFIFRRYYYYSFSVIGVFILSYLVTNIWFPLSGPNFLSQLQSIALTEKSSNWRFELWQNCLDFFISNPIFGPGIGNWKVESLPYWKFLLDGYTVPYHAHNDFFQYFVEIGFIGGILFISYFASLFYIFLKRTFLSNNNIRIVSFFSLLSLISLFIDTFLNFPHERYLLQVSTILLIFISNQLYSDEKFS